MQDMYYSKIRMGGKSLVQNGGAPLDIVYTIIQSIPDQDILKGIIELHKDIFGTKDELINKMARKPKLLVITATYEERVIGYKIGYELDRHTFYSWLGGVDTNYRKHGIAFQLLNIQHRYLKENGYRIVQTKTMNRWRAMLILNIRNGFNVIDTVTDEKGRHKIILEKNLLD
jgi:predicted GNAT superfamily acetyltransferase